MVYFSGAERQGEYGVGFIVAKKMRNYCMGFKPINEIMCKLRIRGKFYNLTLISAYAPTEDAQDEVKEQFYEELNISLEQSPKHDAVIILGDFNAKVGKEMSNLSWIYDILSLTNSTFFTAGTILWCTKNPVPN